MNVLDVIVKDWYACKPKGAVISADNLDRACERLIVRLEGARLSSTTFADINMLLVPCEASGIVPLKQMCRIDCGKDGAAEGVVHFLRFWQASEEVWRRLKEMDVADDEPLVEEMAIFRDTLLRMHDVHGLTCTWLMDAVAGARGMSVDKGVWALLENSVAEFVLSQEDACEEAKAEEPLDCEKPVDLAAISAVILSWMLGLVADYLHGVRSEKVSAVRDVTGCTTREACFHLGAGNWEEEIAICSYYGSALTADNESGWSSQGAKLRKSEVECPICFSPFGGKVKTSVMQCCFQVLCKSCASKLRDRCPFCRGTSECGEDQNEDRHEVQPNTDMLAHPLRILDAFGRAAQYYGWRLLDH